MVPPTSSVGRREFDASRRGKKGLKSSRNKTHDDKNRGLGRREKSPLCYPSSGLRLLNRRQKERGKGRAKRS